MTETIYLVSCVSQKLSHQSSAKDLYTSPLFTKARSYVESTGCDWFILSALYGLVDPNQRIEPYEQTLNRMSALDRRRWAKTVLADLDVRAPGTKKIVFLAGAKYRDDLIPTLRAKGIQIECPMEGLKIGQQLQWLTR